MLFRDVMLGSEARVTECSLNLPPMTPHPNPAPELLSSKEVTTQLIITSPSDQISQFHY